MKVLVVDDSTFMRSNIKKLVKEQGYEVVGEAANGEVALDMILELEPDVVTLDNMMPDMSGLDVLKALQGTHVKSRIVMISAVAQQSAVVDALNSGATQYLVKPFNDKDLVEILNHLKEELK